MNPLIRVISTVCCLSLLSGLVASSASAQTTPAPRRDTTLTSVTDGQEALKMLMAGNERFAAGEKINPDRDKAARAKTNASQRPFAIILSCADSRVAPEILFDAGVGDLFVIRVAGNTLTAEGQASMEYAVAVLGCPLVLVLGHERCGAVDAGLKAYRDGATFPGTIGSLLDDIEPAVAIADGKGELTLETATDENVIYAMDRVRLGGTILPKAIAEGKVVVAGGVYHLEDGKVELLNSACAH